ncbi:ATP synthase F1 subunit delta [Vagococcus carniphilus]|nr:ATP synthase F1 subunit delta [Vagococcus carniphilus]MDT2815597.1 ATP synthase F1 subunit delta [Vagococcus carniphilus]MDT2830769.1 ATP synthase F1 subunit delta [Vagococcus carniphilus]MDT2833072.1 ATP synthase F1 subunit delta [Vagococcus carniphilus]MDT2839459.1 ATP synthase F1 subunit delta [Vagococcus carniphilus]MDT2848522.1 ATP synthase F1 subunit delta [Vagococcus carniphilus]
MNRKYTVAKTYGKALYSEALQLKSVSETYQEMLQLREVYRQVPDLGDILSDDRLSVYEKVNIVKDLENSFGDTVAKFIHTVYDYGRMDEMPEIIDEFEHLYYEQFGIVVVDVTTAVALSMDQRHDLEKRLAVQFHANKVVIRPKLNPAIMGGMIIESEHRVIDQSVRSELEEIHGALLK